MKYTKDCDIFCSEPSSDSPSSPQSPVQSDRPHHLSAPFSPSPNLFSELHTPTHLSWSLNHPPTPSPFSASRVCTCSLHPGFSHPSGQLSCHLLQETGPDPCLISFSASSLFIPVFALCILLCNILTCLLFILSLCH